MATAKAPARLLPLLYLGTAHAALACACGLVAWRPQAVAGFFYATGWRPFVHLVTLGWLTLSILGAMYIVAPLALVPMAAWFWAYERTEYRVPPPSPHAMRERVWQAAVFVAWTIGVPALAAGMGFESAPLLGVGAWVLLAAIVLASLDNARVVAHAVRANGLAHTAAGPGRRMDERLPQRTAHDRR